MTMDRQGILWIATFNGGLSFTSPTTQRFRTLGAIREDELGDPHVAAILEDDRGDLWVGTDGGGLDRFEKSTGRVIRYRHDPGNPQSIGSDAVIALVQDRQGNLWVAGWDSDLMLLDRDSGRVTRFPLAEGYRNVMGMLDDGPDELLLASAGEWSSSIAARDPHGRWPTGFPAWCQTSAAWSLEILGAASGSRLVRVRPLSSPAARSGTSATTRRSRAAWRAVRCSRFEKTRSETSGSARRVGSAF